MKIGLIDVDSHNFPNLALMKISAYHKAIGDEVDWWWGFENYDRIYMSKVFDATYTADIDEPCNSKEIIKGGTGYGLTNKLPDEIEHMMPDYSLYGIQDTAYGFLTRGCPRGCPFCIVEKKEGRKSYKVADLSEWWSGQKNIVLCDPNILGCKEHIDLLGQIAHSRAWVDFNQGLDARLLNRENIEALNKVNTKVLHFAWDLMEQSDEVLKGLNLYLEYGKVKSQRQRMVYVLTNFNTSHDDDLYRIYTLHDMGYEPYVMIFDKPNAPNITRQLQRWCNSKWIFKSCPDFKNYKGA